MPRKIKKPRRSRRSPNLVKYTCAATFKVTDGKILLGSNFKIPKQDAKLHSASILVNQTNVVSGVSSILQVVLSDDDGSATSPAKLLSTNGITKFNLKLKNQEFTFLENSKIVVITGNSSTSVVTCLINIYLIFDQPAVQLISEMQHLLDEFEVVLAD